jgi:hypothetical protein
VSSVSVLIIVLYKKCIWFSKSVRTLLIYTYILCACLLYKNADPVMNDLL